VMVARDILLAELTGAHVHIAHLSTAGAVRLVRDAKARGVRVTADRPVAFQVDGEYMGEHESVLFESIPEAIRVIF